MSEHEHDGSCSCESEDDPIITLELDDGQEVECSVLSIFPLEGKQYIALLPISGDEEEEDEDSDSEVYLYRYSEDENGEPILDNIEDDDEFEAVSDRFDEILDEEEYDEISEEEPNDKK